MDKVKQKLLQRPYDVKSIISHIDSKVKEVSNANKKVIEEWSRDPIYAYICRYPFLLQNTSSKKLITFKIDWGLFIKQTTQKYSK